MGSIIGLCGNSKKKPIEENCNTNPKTTSFYKIENGKKKNTKRRRFIQISEFDPWFDPGQTSTPTNIRVEMMTFAAVSRFNPGQTSFSLGEFIKIYQ